MNETTNTENLKHTALHDEHVKLKARMVPFAGWHMPVQYVGVIEEHETVRKNVGLFDVSHMGEVFVHGPKSLEILQWLTSNDVSKLSAGQAQYSLLLNESGGLVDDIIVYCLEKNSNYMICVNASNADKDFQWMKDQTQKKFGGASEAEIENHSDQWSQIAIQGPKALELASRVLGDDVKKIKSFEFLKLQAAVLDATLKKKEPGTFSGTFSEGTFYVARTGYTGEDGVEVFLPNSEAVGFWNELLQKGKDLGVAPIGLGARDTLRTEMKYSLYGNEITAETSALEAGLGWVIKFQKGDFIGKGALEKQKGGLTNKLVGFKLTDKGIPRQGYPLISFDNIEIGRVTSGTLSPTLKEPIGIGYVKKEWANEGAEFFVQIRGRNARAHVVKTPFVVTKNN